MIRSTLAAALVLPLTACSSAGSPSLADLDDQLPAAVVSESPLQAVVDTSMPDVSGYRMVEVPAGADAQAAIDDAACGTVINLAAGATYGPLKLAAKAPACDAGSWIVIQSSGVSALPAGVRVGMASRSSMARIESRSLNTPAIQGAGTGAGYYRLIGLEITVSPAIARQVAYRAGATFDDALVKLGGKERSADRQPHHIVVDRCYIHGTARGQIRRGVQLNGKHQAIIESYVSDFHQTGFDTQAVATWGGTGPYKIVNDYLEAAGENFLTGGADPAIDGEVPSDIEFRRNYVFKPLTWKRGDPTYAGIPWSVKNLFELKVAKRVWAAGNVLVHTWPDAQVGRAILFTPRCNNSDHQTTRCTMRGGVVNDVLFEYNVVFDVATGFMIVGTDSGDATQRIRAHRITVRHNLVSRILRAGGNGRTYEILESPADLRIEHDTTFGVNQLVVGENITAKAKADGLIIQNELAAAGTYGVFCTGHGIGTSCLRSLDPGYSFTGNVMVDIFTGGGRIKQYPASNRTCQTTTCFPKTWSDVGMTNKGVCNPAAFENLDLAGCALTAGSAYHLQASDGTDIGADIPALTDMVAGVVP